MNTKPFLIVVNGPPSVGKDTSITLLKQYYDTLDLFTKHDKIAQVLRDEACKEFNCKDEDLEELKKVNPDVRKFMIYVSEEVFKPKYGKTYCAEEVIRRYENDKNKNDIKILGISDGGFQDEVDVLINYFGLENSCVIHLKRDGYTFKDDSREPVTHSLNYKEIKNKNIAILAKDLIMTTRKFMGLENE